MRKTPERVANPKSRELFAIVRRSGIVSKQALLEECGLTGSTLTRVLEELVAQELLQEVGLGESTGGRRPILYQVNPGYAYAFGLEISRSLSRLVLTDMHHRILGSAVWNMNEEMNPDRLLRLASQAAGALLEQHGVQHGQVLGVGIGAVGPLDRREGFIREPLYFPNPGWNNVPICALVEERFGLPAYLDNGANTALLAEHWADPDKRQHLLYVHAGIGIRSAMMTGGSIVYGAVDMEGSVGQMIVQADGILHREQGGNFGALESYVSTYGLERRASAALKRGRQSRLTEAVPPEAVTFAMITEAAEADDPLAVELFADAASYFGIGLANLLNVLHPEKVCLGGPVVNAYPPFFEWAVKTALERTYHHPAYQVEFTRGILGESGIAAGAAVMVVNKLTD